MHIFVDPSSVMLHKAAAFVKVINSSTKSCYLVTRKTKIAPMKAKRTILPRLELQATLLVLSIKVTIFEQVGINIKSVFLWSNSKLGLFTQHRYVDVIQLDLIQEMMIGNIYRN